MKNTSKLLLPIIVFGVLWIYSCGSPARKAAPSMSAPSSVSVSRYAHIDEKFEMIAESIDPGVQVSMMEEVLEMCESGESSVRVYKNISETRILYMDTTVRAYMDFLREIGSYQERIDALEYNVDGKIMTFYQIRD
jgi:hypothetical protein